MPRNGSVQDIADYLTDGYFASDGGPRYIGSTIGEVIDVNISGLSAEGRQLAQWAMNAWESVADIDFRVVSGAADVVVNDDGSGATTIYRYDLSTRELLSAEIRISADRIADEGPSIDSYAFRTYVHEFAHVLGLGHAGPYDGEGVSYAEDALWTQDSWQLSIMSYFGQDENPNVVADRAVSVGPMEADLLAIRSIWGERATHYADGNTVWGIGTTLDNWLGDMFRAMETGDSDVFANYRFTLYVEDRSGHDMMDFSHDGRVQKVTLKPGTTNSILGTKNNLLFAEDTVIEDYASGGGADVIRGNGKMNKLWTGRGEDKVYGFGGDDRIWAGHGDDRAFGHAGRDKLFGGNGDDLMRGGGAVDVLRGGGGHDTLFGNAGGDRIVGGGGQDRISGQKGHDRLKGGAGADTIDGSGGHDKLVGGGGGDALYGGGGSDRLTGNFGADVLKGGNRGDDLFGGGGRDTIDGGRGNDLLDGGGGTDRLNGGGGHDILDGGRGADILKGRGGDDELQGGAGSDRVLGNGGDDTIYGGALGDRLAGQRGNDVIRGGEGSDVLRGGGGDDRLEGGAGPDRMTGGGGADEFVFDGGTDTITDYRAGMDRILIDAGAGWDDLQSVLDAPRQMDGETMLKFADGARLVLIGVDDVASLDIGYL